jgi:putative heme-binding domain-containing protein
LKLQTYLATASIVAAAVFVRGIAAAADEFAGTVSRATTVAATARLKGDPRRGALVFHKSAAACVKCHAGGKDASPLGPDLTTIARDATDEYLVEAILEPSKTIRKGFETVTVTTLDGKVKTGLVAADTKEHLVLRDAANLEQAIRIAKDEVDQVEVGRKSMMPEGLAATLGGEQDLYDLVRYVMEAARGGPARAAALRPDAEELAVRDDTADLDHAGILRSLGQRDFEAGKQIFLGQCKACHGADGNTPTLPTARAFGRQPLKYGADPYRMLMTLTRGSGLMAPMQQLSPKERYQVVHYIREALMKPSNPAYREADDEYLNGLPRGKGDGEVAVSTASRDYGPVLGSQIGTAVNNALTFRLPGDVTVAYDLHRMRTAGAWTGGFLDLSQTHHYRQRGEQMPKIDGEPIAGLGDWEWAWDGSFEIPAGAKPPRGPVRSDLLEYYGHYLHGNRAVLSYGIEERKILETIGSSRQGSRVVLEHTLRVEPGERPLKLCVARLNGDNGSSGLLATDLLATDLLATGLPAKGGTSMEGRSGPANDRIAVVSGKAPKTGEPTMANRPRHVVEGAAARRLDLGTPGRTILVGFRTTGDGTLVASAPAQGIWKPNGKALFVRGKRLVYDIGWVGAMTGKSDVCDGRRHVAALVVTDRATKLFVDGVLEAEREGFRRKPENGQVFKIGATATNFGGDFPGEIDQVGVYDSEFSADQLAKAATSPPERSALFTWRPEQGKPGASRGGTGVEPAPATRRAEGPKVYAAAVVSGDTEGLTWEIDDEGRIVLFIPAGREPRVFRVVRSSTTDGRLDAVCDALRAAAKDESVDPRTLTRGGPLRWPERLEVRGKLGEPINGYALDSIPVPFENPWNAWLRTSALDFFDDGRAVVTTHGGDVYVVSGIDARMEQVVWKRFAAGLFEPFGVRVVDGVVYVTCRDGIKRLHDFNADGEADFVEAFWNDDDVSCSFHAYNFDLQTDSSGNFYFAKSGQYSQHGRPGTIMRVPPEGRRADVVAWGLRTPNGMGKLADDRFTVSDNQGPWMPAGKISLVRPGRFLGNMPINDEQTRWLEQRHGGKLPDTFDEPIVWTPQELDNSCGGQLWVDDRRFGPLSGRLLHSSFGKGRLYYLSLQESDGPDRGSNQAAQASIVSLPHQWDAGVMRLRVNPADGQVYGTGMSGWQGPAQGKDGCLQRLRYVGGPVKMIDRVRVVAGGLEVAFNFALDPKSACDPRAWRGEMWDYRWSKQYGSDEYSVLRPGTKGRDPLTIADVGLIDERTVHLGIPDLRVCDQLSLEMNFQEAEGARFVERAYLTVHFVPDK